LCAGLAAAAGIDHSEKHRSPTRTRRKPPAFRGTSAKEFPIVLADNEFKIEVDALDEATLMEGMQKVANRIALGLVLAALIVGAALLMDVPTSFVLFGYPGLAMLLFLGAAAGGAALAVSIRANDIRSRRKAKP
jgi:hypothetical protein